MGNMFLKLPTRQSRTMLAQDQLHLVVYRSLCGRGGEQELDDNG